MLLDQIHTDWACNIHLLLHLLRKRYFLRKIWFWYVVQLMVPRLEKQDSQGGTLTAVTKDVIMNREPSIPVSLSTDTEGLPCRDKKKS